MNTVMGSSLGLLYLTLVCFILFRQTFSGDARNHKIPYLLKEPIVNNLFITAPSTSPKKSPVCREEKKTHEEV